MTLTAEQIKEKITILTRERAQIKTRITKLKNYLVNSGSYADGEYIDRNLQKIETDLTTIPRIHEDLTKLEPEVIHKEAEEAIEDDFAELMVLIRKFKEPSRDQNAQSTHDTPTTDARSPSINSHLAAHDYYSSLPKMEVKKFDGKLENWRQWRDWFIPTIHKRETLTNAQRLDLMKRRTSGEAANTISAFTPTDENYAAAWELLESTYDIEHILILRHYDLLMETPVMKKNSAEELKKLTNHVHTQVLAMKALGEKVEHWNTPLVHTILNRLDKETTKEWNRTQQNDVMPTYEELMSYLRKEAVKLTPMTPSGGNQSTPAPFNSQKPKNGNNKSNGQKSHSYLTTSAEKACPLCKEQHTLENCEKFLTLNVSERIQAGRNARLCLNCLRPNHLTRFCRSEKCSTCSKKHNVLLHLSETELGAINKSSA